jgi:hypothetical protein
MTHTPEDGRVMPTKSAHSARADKGRSYPPRDSRLRPNLFTWAAMYVAGFGIVSMGIHVVHGVWRSPSGPAAVAGAGHD